VQVEERGGHFPAVGSGAMAASGAASSSTIAMAAGARAA
jgi:hypothetical protein